LDEGFVALVDYMGDDGAIEQAARVSYGAGTRAMTETRQLIRYLMRHKHTTPFEMVELKFHVKLPIFVARQLVRHRTASLNEYSMRYSLAPLQFYMPEFDQVRTQSKKNKQGRADNVAVEVYERITLMWQELCGLAGDIYKEAALVEDIAREISRIGLPVNLYTEWYWKIDLHNLFHFMTLRSDEQAQWEIQQYSNVKAGIAQRVAPLAFEAWIDYAFCARTFSRMELQAMWNHWTHGAPIGEASLTALGLGKRELAEYKAKTIAVPEPPNYELDLSKTFPAEHFFQRAEALVPKRNDSPAHA
jgi:thymidylate synthase (FAD)